MTDLATGPKVAHPPSLPRPSYTLSGDEGPPLPPDILRLLDVCARIELRRRRARLHEQHALVSAQRPTIRVTEEHGE